MDPGTGTGDIQHHLRTLAHTDAAAAALAVVDSGQAAFTHGNGVEGTHFDAGAKPQAAKVAFAGTAVVFGDQMAVFDAGVIVQLGRVFLTAVAGDAGHLAQVGR